MTSHASAARGSRHPWIAGLLVFLATSARSTAAASLPSKRQDHRLDDGIHYVTRPDIEAPTWNVTVYDEKNYSPGYWFVGVYDYLDQSGRNGGLWNAPHIFDNYGELIWSGSYISQRYDSFDFRISDVLGEDMFTFYYPHNRSAMVLDEHFNWRQSWPTSNVWNEKDNMHDLHFVANGTRALFFYDKPKTVEWKGGDKRKCRVMDCCFRERNLETAHVDFEWCVSDHIDVGESMYENLLDVCQPDRNEWDFIHANALDKFPDGSYLLNGRYTNAMYKIDPNGTVIWRMGGNNSDFVADFTFSRQHHSRIHSTNDTHTVISIFDNAISEELEKGSAPYSRGLFFQLDESVKPMTATLLAEYPHPWGKYTQGRGSTQRLPGGNVFQCFVDFLLHTEHTEDGTLVMEGKVKQEWLKSYRSYKFDFVGRPSQPPDIHSTVEIHHGQTKTIVHVSWNGATEVANWKLFSIDPESTERKLLTQALKKSFETRLQYDGFVKYVQVEAYDKNDQFLGWTQIFNTKNSELSNGNWGEDDNIFTDEMPEDSEPIDDSSSLSSHAAELGNDASSWTPNLQTPAGKGAVGIALAFIVVGLLILCVGRKLLTKTGTAVQEKAKGWRRRKNQSHELRDVHSEGEDELFIPAGPGLEKP